MSAILHVFSGYLLCCVLSTIISVIMTRYILFLKKFYCIRFLKWTWWNLARFVYEMHEYRVDSVMVKKTKKQMERVYFLFSTGYWPLVSTLCILRRPGYESWRITAGVILKTAYEITGSHLLSRWNLQEADAQCGKPVPMCSTIYHASFHRLLVIRPVTL